MPRVTADRLRAAEDAIADRIAHERQARGWSYEKLAAQMRDHAGYVVQPSAIQRVEKGNPRRRIVVDEFVAYVRVFQGSVMEWLMPDAERDRMKFDSQMRRGAEATELVERKRRELADAELQLRDALEGARAHLNALPVDERAAAVEEAEELDADLGEHWADFRRHVVAD
ncbi:hypothetical protein [Microcella sp.]|uniref:hypothetical protein n=1 Tax=Microcella sp. TaxID=1913979 RepID=UPI00391A94C6